MTSNLPEIHQDFSKSNLVWIDLEMTGLNPKTDQILESAILITDKDLNQLHPGLNLVVKHPLKVLEAMDDWNTKTHTKTGLFERSLNSKLSLAEVEAQMLAYLKHFIPEKSSPLCGNSVYQDRMFLVRLMPTFNDYVHYRNIDVSTIKELSRIWYPKIGRYTKAEKHSALQDILESIAELKFYKENYFKSEQEIKII